MDPQLITQVKEVYQKTLTHLNKLTSNIRETISQKVLQGADPTTITTDLHQIPLLEKEILRFQAFIDQTGVTLPKPSTTSRPARPLSPTRKGVLYLFFQKPILEAIARCQTIQPNDVSTGLIIREISEFSQANLTAYDFRKTRSGKIRWHAKVSDCLSRLVQEGFVVRDGKNLRLTPKGQEALQNESLLVPYPIHQLRGDTLKRIESLSREANHPPFKVTELAKTLGMPTANLHVWFATTGKKYGYHRVDKGIYQKGTN